MKIDFICSYDCHSILYGDNGLSMRKRNVMAIAVEDAAHHVVCMCTSYMLLTLLDARIYIALLLF